MKPRIDPFTYNLPSLDLHGETSDFIEVLINGFINDNLKIQKHKLLIIHGKGEGILKNKTHDILSHHKQVIKYYLDTNNLGQTIVELEDKIL